MNPWFAAIAHRPARQTGRPLAVAVVVLLAIFPTSPLAALQEADQDDVLAGVVVSASDGAPVASANIRVEGTERRTFTGPTGRFQLTDLPSGEHVLVVERLGFATERVPVQGAAGEGPLEIRLTSEPVLVSGLVITTSGELQRRVETPASVSRIDGERIREVNPTHPAEVMNRVPGVWVSPTSTEGHMTAIRQPITTNPVYLFLEDGVPTRSPGFFNHNALYEVNVPQADQVEVIRGPGTSLYGSDAIGGVVNVGTRPPSSASQLEATLEGNSLGFGRALGSASDTWGDHGFRIDANVTEGDDWRDHAGYDRQSATLRWDMRMDEGRSLRTTATFSRVYQEDPSVISWEDLETDPSVNHHPITFRTVRAFRIQSQFERRADRSLLQLSPFLRWNSLDLMPSWMLSYDPVIYESGHWTTGIMARYHRDVDVLRSRLTVGVDVDRSPGGREEHRISVGHEDGAAVTWEREELIYDYDATYLGISPYLQLQARPMSRLHLTAGLRFDDMRFTYRNHLTPLQTGPHRRPQDTTVTYTNLGPSLGAAVTVRPELNFFAGFRESFRSPSEGQLFRQGTTQSTVDLKPVKARSIEGGVRGELTGRVAYELALYRMDVRDDILDYVRPEDGLRESLNAGRTRHQGLEAGVTLGLPAGAEADVSLTRASHRYLEWSPRDEVDYSGNRIEQAPRDLASARLRFPFPGLDEGRVEVEWMHMGGFWMDPENENRYGGHDLWNLRIEAPIYGGIALSGRVMNLTDLTYAERASFNAFRGAELSPGKPRTIQLALRYQWDR